MLINHNITNSFAAYGLDHFMYKYGFTPITNSHEQADIEIKYSDSSQKETQAKILIQIFPNKIQHEIKGYINSSIDFIPLFQTPRQLDFSGKTIANFRGLNSFYPCIASNSNYIEIGFDIFNEIGHILAGHIESALDQSSSEYAELSKSPIVDNLEELLFDILKTICQENNIELKSKPFWPEKKNFALCLTHDVDRVYKTYQYIPSILKCLRRANLSDTVAQIKSMLFKHGKSNPYWTFNKIIDIENELGVKSSFYFLNESGKLAPLSLKSWILFTGRYKIDSVDIIHIMMKLLRNGFDIGVHGSFNSYKDVKLLKAEKIKLESIIGDRICGVRQHYLNFNQSTFIFQESAGFKFDTSVGFKDNIGFRRGTCFPYRIFDYNSNKILSLLEIPLIIMDSAMSIDKHTLKQCIELMDIVEKKGGILVLLWHQDRFSEIDFPDFIELYKQLIIAAKDRNAWITTASSINSWWQMNNNRNISIE